MNSNILNQKSIKNPTKFNGIGLHSGRKVEVKILPSSPNTGITFIRNDLKKNNIIIPNVFNVSEASFCTSISNEFGVKISVARQKALKGVRLCLSCQEEVDREEISSLTINRRANKDSQLR